MTFKIRLNRYGPSRCFVVDSRDRSKTAWNWKTGRMNLQNTLPDYEEIVDLGVILTFSCK
jgi:hypothetical protein